MEHRALYVLHLRIERYFEHILENYQDIAQMQCELVAYIKGLWDNNIVTWEYANSLIDALLTMGN